MAETSAIEWTDATVNFWWGCTKVGPGCDHCYAHDIRLFTAALLDGRVNDDRVDVQLPVQLFGLHGHVAIQPQQIKSNNSPHARPRFRRGHYRARALSQTQVAARAAH